MLGSTLAVQQVMLLLWDTGVPGGRANSSPGYPASDSAPC